MLTRNLLALLAVFMVNMFVRMAMLMVMAMLMAMAMLMVMAVFVIVIMLVGVNDMLLDHRALEGVFVVLIVLGVVVVAFDRGASFFMPNMS